MRQPRTQFETAEEAVQFSLTWEQTVTKQINSLADLAAKENDHLTRHILQWFVNEQARRGFLHGGAAEDGPARRRKGLLMVEDYLARTPDEGVPRTSPYFKYSLVDEADEYWYNCAQFRMKG